MSLEEFSAYDFDEDKGWLSYQRNLTFPPGREDLIIKYKAKYYKNNINADFDPTLITLPETSSSSHRQTNPTAAPTHQHTPPQPKQQTPPPPPPPPPQQQQPSHRLPNNIRIGIGDIALFGGHLFLIITSVLALIPFNRVLSYNCYFSFCRVSIVIHAARLVRRHGVPSMRGILPWFRTVSSTTEAFYALSSMLLLSNPHGWIGIYPMAVLALYHAMAFMNSAFGRTVLWKSSGLSTLYTMLASQRDDALLMTSTVEIVTVFQLLIGVFRVGPGALMVCWVYLSQLKMRYWSPESRIYHIRAWSVIGDKMQPLLRAVPLLCKGIERGKTWFNSVPQQQGQR